MYINKVFLFGNLTRDPEMRALPSGMNVVNFSLATNERYRNASGEKITETTWHNLVAWGKVAEIAEKYLLKGSEVIIEGKIINRSYTDKDGVKKYVSEVQVNELLLLDGKPEA